MMARYTVEPQAPGTSSRQQAAWQARHNCSFDVAAHEAALLAVIQAIQSTERFDGLVYDQIVRQAAREGHPFFSKEQLRIGYRALVEAGRLTYDEETAHRLKMKPVRTLSGVAPVTVLTKPYPCPGRCIFCPDDVRMPKSYLRNEPGAMRALMLDFDPYLQTRRRMAAMQKTGHRVQKVELLILGGTWSSYPAD